MEQEGNLKPAPFGLTPATVESALKSVTLQNARMTHLPIAPLTLVDRPRRSANPVLAKANDDNVRPIAERRDVILAALQKQREAQAQGKARISMGQRVKKQVQPAPQPYELRRQHLQRATDFLRARGVLVMVHERDAAVRRYRVTGRTELLLAEDVIALAVRRGMGVEAQA